MEILKGDGKVIFAIFIGAIITITLLSLISDNVFEQTTVRTFTNTTLTAGAVNATVDLAGREAVTLTEAYNSSGDTCIDLGCNLQTGIGTNGLLSVQVVVNDTGVDTHAARTLNVSYKANPDGYLNLSSARSINSLIVLFGALAILVTVIALLWKGSLGDMVRRQ